MFGNIPPHPVIVHTPVALLLFSALFAIGGRLFDRDWVRRASVLLLVFGFLGAIAANLSGNAAESIAEERQGVPERPLEDHEKAGRMVMFVSGAAVLAFAGASRSPERAKRLLGTVGFILQLAAAAAVARTGFLGGELTYEHAAGVRVGGEYVQHPGHTGERGEDPRDGEAKH